MLRIVKFPSTTAVLPFGREPNALRHVIAGSGRPVAWHGKITFSPTSATIDEGFWVIEAATVDLSEQTYMQLANEKRLKRKQKLLGTGVRISMSRTLIIHPWHELSLVRLPLACVAGVRKGRGRELGRETTREGGGRRGTPARKPLFSPSRLLIKKITKITATVND